MGKTREARAEMQRMVDFLNWCWAVDPRAVDRLFQPVFTNGSFDSHPHIQVAPLKQRPEMTKEATVMTFTGLLNGFFQADGPYLCRDIISGKFELIEELSPNG